MENGRDIRIDINLFPIITFDDSQFISEFVGEKTKNLHVLTESRV